MRYLTIALLLMVVVHQHLNQAETIISASTCADLAKSELESTWDNFITTAEELF